MKRWWVLKIAKGIVFIALMTTVFGFVVLSLWNALIPELFNGPVLTFWQAIGLLLLSHILLRGWMPWRHAGGWRHDRWRKRFEEKLAAMTPEERERFKQQWPHRCGWHGHESDAKTDA
jgi:hypothetical protein